MSLIHYSTRFANCFWSIRYFSQSQICLVWECSCSITLLPVWGFMSLLNNLQQTFAPHGSMAIRTLSRLCEGDIVRKQEILETARASLRARIIFWNWVNEAGMQVPA